MRAQISILNLISLINSCVYLTAAWKSESETDDESVLDSLDDSNYKFDFDSNNWRIRSSFTTRKWVVYPNIEPFTLPPSSYEDYSNQFANTGDSSSYNGYTHYHAFVPVGFIGAGIASCCFCCRKKKHPTQTFEDQRGIIGEECVPATGSPPPPSYAEATERTSSVEGQSVPPPPYSVAVEMRENVISDNSDGAVGVPVNPSAESQRSSNNGSDLHTQNSYSVTLCV